MARKLALQEEAAQMLGAVVQSFFQLEAKSASPVLAW